MASFYSLRAVTPEDTPTPPRLLPCDETGPHPEAAGSAAATAAVASALHRGDNGARPPRAQSSKAKGSSSRGDRGLLFPPSVVSMSADNMAMVESLMGGSWGRAADLDPDPGAPGALGPGEADQEDEPQKKKSEKPKKKKKGEKLVSPVKSATATPIQTAQPLHTSGPAVPALEMPQHRSAAPHSGSGTSQPALTAVSAAPLEAVEPLEQLHPLEAPGQLLLLEAS